MRNLSPKSWGQPMWFSIHSIAYAYTPSNENIAYYRSFFTNLGNILPCEHCRIHYNENLKLEELEVALGSSDLLFKWTYDFHNLVNKQNGVTSYPTLEEVKRNYKFYEANCSAETGTCGSSAKNRDTAITEMIVVSKYIDNIKIAFSILSIVFFFILVGLVVFRPT